MNRRIVTSIHLSYGFSIAVVSQVFANKPNISEQEVEGRPEIYSPAAPSSIVVSGTFVYFAATKIVESNACTSCGKCRDWYTAVHLSDNLK